MPAAEATPQAVSARPAITADLMARTGLDDAVLSRLVQVFYSAVRADPLLGPDFADRITNWPRHQEQMGRILLLGHADDRALSWCPATKTSASARPP